MNREAARQGKARQSKDLTGQAYPPTIVRACLRTIPFSEQVRQNVMSALTAFNTLNIFQYNQLADASPALNQGVNLDDECE